jgi:tRNA dimethylallyltransferase
VWEGLPVATNQEVRPVFAEPPSKIVDRCDSRGAISPGGGDLDPELTGPEKKEETLHPPSHCPACAGADFVSTQSGDSAPRQHLVGYRRPEVSDTFSIREWLQDALACAASIQTRRHVPIVVGGTNYYAEALLWSGTIMDDEKPQTATGLQKMDDSAGSGIITEGLRERVAQKLEDFGKLETGSADPGKSETAALIELHNLLQLVDPVSAAKLHQNDFRRVRRCLEIVRDTGFPRNQKGATADGEQKSLAGSAEESFRFSSGLIFWVRCRRDVLTERLDRRIDTMLERGLVGELAAFYDRYLKRDSITSTNTTVNVGSEQQVGGDTSLRGPFAAIGFKEFLPYLRSTGGDDFGRDAALLDPCVRLLKKNTKRYAGQQETWLRNRMVRRLAAHRNACLAANEARTLWLFVVDSTEGKAEDWQRQIDRAIQVTRSFAANDVAALAGHVATVDAEFLSPPSSGGGTSEAAEPAAAAWQKFTCADCTRTLNGLREWNEHLRSRSHRKRISTLKRKAKKRASAGQRPGPRELETPEDGTAGAAGSEHPVLSSEEPMAKRRRDKT